MIKKGLSKVKIAGINLNSASKRRVLRKICQRIALSQKTFVVTPNPEFIVFSQKRPWFSAILNQADLAVPDTIGLVLAGKILKKPIQRFPGIDLMASLCQTAAKKNWSVFLFGARPGVAKKAFQTLKASYPSLKGWVESGPKKGEIIDNKSWVEKINQKQPDLLFVALGMGKQEKFISDNWSQLKVKLAMGVGGAFDYLSGEVPRAPEWLRKIGFEWLYRLLREPWRWRRQLRLVNFLGLILKEKFS